MTRALAGHIRERALEQLALAPAADHRRLVAALWCLDPHGDEPMCGEQTRLALRDHRAGLVGDDRLPHEAVRLLAEQNLARLRRLLQARRDVDGVACCKPLLGARDDLARVHAHAQLEPRPVVAFELLVEPAQTPAQLPRGAHRAQRVVLMHGRHAEDGHHRVADELLDGAAVPLDDRLGGLEVARHHAPEALRVDPLAERRRPAHVAEQHRHDFAHLARRCGLGQGSTAGVAETCALPIFGPAARADEHGSA
jgi:hypothetical protein